MSGSPTSYLLTSYGEMISGVPRTPAYAEALAQVVTPGCKVIDIGAGPGFFALLACKYGAGEVVAIEPNNSVELLRAAAIANDCADRIHVHHGLSTDYASERRADVIISDLRGCLPLFEAHVPAIVDARERLLAPGGRLIPMRDVLRVALVDHEATYAPFEQPWLANRFDIDLSCGHRHAVNQWIKVVLGADALLSAAGELVALDYATITDPNVAADVTLAASRAGTAHGLVVWFDAELAPGIGFSNAPGEPEQVYGQTFFPFERPIALAAGEEVQIAIRADLVAGTYVWSWNTTVASPGRDAPVRFRQSSFLAKILSPKRVETSSSRFAPPRLPAHDVDLFCLSLFDGEASLAEIADQLVATFPDQFKSSAEALAHATTLAGRYHDERSPRNRPAKGDDR